MKYTKKQNVVKAKFPSEFGSHTVMLDAEYEAANEGGDDVVCRDDRGSYVTDRRSLDNGLADFERFVGGGGGRRTERLSDFMEDWNDETEEIMEGTG